MLTSIDGITAMAGKGPFMVKVIKKSIERETKKGPRKYVGFYITIPREIAEEFGISDDKDVDERLLVELTTYKERPAIVYYKP